MASNGSYIEGDIAVPGHETDRTRDQYDANLERIKHEINEPGNKKIHTDYVENKPGAREKGRSGYSEASCKSGRQDSLKYTNSRDRGRHKRNRNWGFRQRPNQNDTVQSDVSAHPKGDFDNRSSNLNDKKPSVKRVACSTGRTCKDGPVTPKTDPELPDGNERGQTLDDEKHGKTEEGLPQLLSIETDKASTSDASNYICNTGKTLLPGKSKINYDSRTEKKKTQVQRVRSFERKNIYTGTKRDGNESRSATYAECSTKNDRKVDTSRRSCSSVDRNDNMNDGETTGNKKVHTNYHSNFVKKGNGSINRKPIIPEYKTHRQRTSMRTQSFKCARICKETQNKNDTSEVEVLMSNTPRQCVECTVEIHLENICSYGALEMYALLSEQVGKDLKYIILYKEAGRNKQTLVLLFPCKNESEKLSKSPKLHTRQRILQVIEVKTCKLEYKTIIQELMANALKHLKDHEQKLSKIKTEIQQLQNKKNTCDPNQIEKDLFTIDALKFKQRELLEQKAEFCQAVDRLYEETCAEEEALTHGRERFRKECKKLSSALPMYAKRTEILNLVGVHQVVVILGETGSGKSTQVPVYLYEAGFGNTKPIVCTQPRKVAALSLANHVAEEIGCRLGNEVGYRIGRQNRTNRNTQLVYMTDHCLLNECVKNPDLTSYSCVIVDEAHERTIYTDLLLGMVKKCMTRRPDLKVIITSATIEPQQFVEYFGGRENCPVMTVPGRQFPVSVVYDEEQCSPDKDYVERAVEKAMYVHRTEDLGDVLVFLATPAETERACDMINSRHQDCKVQVFSLHGRQQPQDQRAVFQKASRIIRKLIFATNVAETSITIPGISYVIDTGLCKEKKFDPKKNMSLLEIGNISKSSADQRKGRAGRTSPGVCFRLYTKDEYGGMSACTRPEILRVHLGQAMLQLMVLGVEDPLSFEFVDAPSPEAVQSAIGSLLEIGAISADFKSLTRIGKELAKLTLEPRLAKFVLDGVRSGIEMEAVVAAAYLSSGSGAFFRAGTEEDKRKADSDKAKFCLEDGDLLTFLQVYKDWQRQAEKDKSRWCMENSINGKTMRGVREQSNEIRFNLRRELNMDVNTRFKDNYNVVRDTLVKTILRCFPSNLCRFSSHLKAGYAMVSGSSYFHIHPSSALRLLGITPPWIVYTQLLKTSQDFMINLTVVSEELVRELFAGTPYLVNEFEIQGKMVISRQIGGIGSYLLRFLKKQNTGYLLQEQISQRMGGNPVILDIDSAQIRATLITPSQTQDKATEELQQVLEPERNQLRKEQLNERISPNSPFVTIIGSGGTTEQLVMPDEVRILHVAWRNGYMSEDKEKTLAGYMREHCDCVEEINDSRLYTHLKFTVSDPSKSSQVVADVKKRFTWLQIWSESIISGNNLLTLKLSWIRRPLQGFVAIKFADPQIALLASRLLIYHHKNSKVCKIQRRYFVEQNNPQYRECTMGILGPTVLVRYPGRDPCDIELKNIDQTLDVPEVVEEVREILKKCCSLAKIDDIVVPRKKSFHTAFGDRLQQQHSLTRQIEEISKQQGFNVDILDPKPEHVSQYAFVTFEDQMVGIQVLEQLYYEPASLQRFTKHIHGEMFVRRKPMKILQSALDELERNLTGSQSIRKKQMKSGHWRLYLLSGSMPDYVDLKHRLEEMFKPYTINCGDSSKAESELLLPSSRNAIQTAAHQTKTDVQVDVRAGTVQIVGMPADIVKARRKLEFYLEHIKGTGEVTIMIGGSQRPTGFLRTFLKRFGLQLEELREKCGLLSVDLSLRNHTCRARGDSAALSKLRKIIDDLDTELGLEIRPSGDHICDEKGNNPDCSVCLCPVDKDMYRLQVCGHAYCRICVSGLVQNAIAESNFPVMCATADCSESVSIMDFKTLLQEFGKLVNASVNCYLRQNQNHVKSCVTVDCPGLFRVTENASTYVCPSCSVRACTGCGSQVHLGLTCEENRFVGEHPSDGAENWVKLDRNRRAFCPGCNVPILKTEGCNHMNCSSCKVHFCWICKKTFEISNECYDHLRKVHGGI